MISGGFPSVTIAQLINAGHFPAPIDIEGHYFGKPIKARILKDGTINFENQIFNSASVAAGKAITATAGITTRGRPYFSINGWKFWHITMSDGSTKSLADVRAEFERSSTQLT